MKHEISELILYGFVSSSIIVGTSLSIDLKNIMPLVICIILSLIVGIIVAFMYRR